MHLRLLARSLMSVTGSCPRMTSARPRCAHWEKAGLHQHGAFLGHWPVSPVGRSGEDCLHGSLGTPCPLDLQGSYGHGKQWVSVQCNYAVLLVHADILDSRYSPNDCHHQGPHEGMLHLTVCQSALTQLTPETAPRARGERQMRTTVSEDLFSGGWAK